jgi:hypothetical protein
VCVVVGTFWNDFRVFTSQAVFIDNLALSARGETRISIDTGDESTTISWQGESGIRPELVGQSVRLNFIRASIADNLFRIALIKEEVGPVA